MTKATDAAHHVEETHEFALPHTALSDKIESVVRGIGKVSAWLWFALLVVIIVQVVLRYVFNQGSVMLEEIQWHLFGIGFMLGLSYALVEDRHVRVDVVAERLRPKARAWIEIVGLCVFLLPFSLTLVVEGIPYAVTSYTMNEISSAPDGLPYRWIPKSFIPIAMFILALAAFARLLRAVALVRGTGYRRAEG